MKYLLIFFSLFLYSQKTIQKVSYYDYNKTKVKEIYTVIQIKGINTLHGVYKEYDEYGNLFAERNYSYGKLNGETKIFLSSKEAYLFSNNPNGFLNSYAGKLWRVYNYKNDLFDGKNIEYDFDNETSKLFISSEKIFKNGILINEKIYYNINQPKNIISNNCECFTFYQNGNLEKHYFLKNGKRNGKYEIYFDNGKIKSSVEYKNDEKNGVLIYYCENGNVDYKEFFKNDVKIGNTIDYNEYGEEIDKSGNNLKTGEEILIKKEGERNLNIKFLGNSKYLLTEYYENGTPISIRESSFISKFFVRDGKETIYTEDGKLSGWYNFKPFYYGNTVYDRKFGEFSTFYENGNPFSVGSFKNDILVGKCINFYDNGNIKEEFLFNDTSEIPNEDNEKYCRYKSYYLNGKLKSFGTFKDFRNNLKYDDWKYFDENGNEIAETK